MKLNNETRILSRSIKSLNKRLINLYNSILNVYYV